MFVILPPQAILLTVYTCVRVHVNVCDLPPQAILLTVYTCVRVHMNVCDLASSSHPIDCVYMCACAHECL